MTQQAMMQISLKMLLSKFVLASMTMSKCGRFRFQLIGIVFQQALLKGHSKKRWKLVSSCPVRKKIH
jgi:hypothetical protein